MTGQDNAIQYNKIQLYISQECYANINQYFIKWGGENFS